jgi:mRNA interferase RelE/StbE
MKVVEYSRDAAKDLRRHGNVAPRIRSAFDQQAHANNITLLVGSAAKRLRVGDFRVIFDETETMIRVTKIGPRGGIYE